MQNDKKWRYFSPYDHKAYSFQSKRHHNMLCLYDGLQFWQSTKKLFIFVLDRIQRVVWRIDDNILKKHILFQLWTRYYTKTLRQLLTLLTKCQKYATFFCHVQVTFRQLLTMLAIFDLSFIIGAFISFSLPQLSPHWKVSRIRIALMKIFAHCCVEEIMKQSI